jgi:hypothetical protein
MHAADGPEECSFKAKHVLVFVPLWITVALFTVKFFIHGGSVAVLHVALSIDIHTVSMVFFQLADRSEN